MFNSKTKTLFLYAVVLILSSLGLYGASSLSYTTFMGGKGCPQLVVMPACYIVALGYFGIVVSLLLKNTLLFLVSWTPLFLIALGASTLEVFRGGACPYSPSGFPMCYSSLFLLIIIFILTFVLKKSGINKSIHS